MVDLDDVLSENDVKIVSDAILNGKNITRKAILGRYDGANVVKALLLKWMVDYYKRYGHCWASEWIEQGALIKCDVSMTRGGEGLKIYSDTIKKRLADVQPEDKGRDRE